MRHQDTARPAEALRATWWTSAAVMTAALLGLSVLRLHAVTGTAVDRAVLSWMVDHRHPALTSWAVAITDVGSPLGVAILAGTLGGLLWWRTRQVVTALSVVATVAGAAATSAVLKVAVAVHRPPPSVQLMAETDHSFPSGHVTATVALCGMAAVVLGPGARPAMRLWLACTGAAAIIAVTLTRLYLGVHWLTDVLGGLLVGGLAVLAGTVLTARSTPRTECAFYSPQS